MKFGLVSASYIIEDGVTKAVLFCRDEKRSKVVFKVPYFPYFYVKSENLQKIKEHLMQKELWQYVVSVSRKTYLGDYGNKVRKITVRFPSVVRKMRDVIESFGYATFEADIPFYLRFLIDSGIRSGFEYNGEYSVVNEVSHRSLRPVEYAADLRVGFIDIEVAVRRPEELRKFSGPVIVVGIYDSYTEEYVQFIDEDEKRLLESVLIYLSWAQFDVLVSFSDIDVPYLLNRMERYWSIDYRRLSLIGRVSIDRAKILGTEILDIAKLYRKVSGEPEWNTLDYIARKELGRGKVELEKSVYELWRDREKDLLLRYNRRDVELIVELERRLGLISNYADPVRRIVGCNLEDVFYPNRISDILYLRLVHGKIVFLTRSPFKYQGTTYAGAIVVISQPGIYDNVLVLDWSEMYPSIIETLNIGWNTFSPYGEIDIDGVKFTLKEKSWTTIILEELRKMRREKKRKAKEAEDDVEKRKYSTLSKALKAIINAAYGSYGFAGEKKGRPSRFYSLAIAKSITYVGREVLKESIRYLKEIGYEVVYGDTDSVFILLKENSEEEIERLANLLETHIAEYISGRWKVPRVAFKIDVEKVFRRVIIPRKKRYHGITVSGEEEVKGLEAIRKDTAPLTAEVQLNIGRMILEGRSREEIKERVREYYHRVRSGKASISEVMLKGRCAKETYKTKTLYMRAVHYANILFGEEIHPGERFYWSYIKGVYIDGHFSRGYDSICRQLKRKPEDLFVGSTVDVVASRVPYLPSNVVIDWERMADRVVLSPIRKYLELLGIKDEEIHAKSLLEYIAKE